MVRRVGNGGAAIDVGGKDQVVDGDAVVIHQDALDIVRAAGGGTVEHVGDVGGDGGEVVEILEAPDLLDLIGEHPVEEQVAVLEAHGADGDDGVALLEVFVGDEVLRDLGNGGDHQVRAADDLLIGVAQDEMHVRVLTEQVHDAVFVAVVADELQGDGAAVPLRPQRSDKRPDAHSHDVPQANEAHGLEVRPGEQAGGVGGGDAGAEGGDVLPVHQGLENAGVGLVEQDVAHHYGALLAPLDAVAADHLHHGQVAPLIDAGHDVVIVAILLGDVDFGGQGVAGLFPQGLVHPADELAVRSLGCNGPDGFKIKYFRVFSLHFHLSSLI